ncbi:hypothetical protein [Streptosporangium minutum]|uniref:TetR family transcriptional regulator n=1 Tax=Streptosporangium minutum TaxID=569862 RepID=A0A243RWA7_9ACTN|nr:hypothetical protein [Streptosporangium minutum]OUC99462.1 hypothetical protein CA984_02735 [Streptosporangium minutum]
MDIEQKRYRAMQGFAELTRRAKTAGRLRADFAQDDLALLLMANGGIIAESTEAALASSRRLVAYMLSAFRAEQAEPLPPPAPLDLRDVLNTPASTLRPAPEAGGAGPAGRRGTSGRIP